MVVIDYNKKYHGNIINSCVAALRAGKVVAYPTDTSYGLAVDATNIRAIKKLYKVKGRNFNKPVHVVVPSVAYAKKIVGWNSSALKLAKKFWPGALTLVLPVGNGRGRSLRRLSVGSGYLGIRIPKNQIALDLAKHLKKPITATSANIAGQPDCYSADDIIAQFSARGGSASGGKNKKHRPDILINAGKLPRRKPSTVVKIENHHLQVLRAGSISQKQILKYV